MNTFHALKYLYLDRNKFGRCLKKSYLSGRCYLPRSKLPTFTVLPSWIRIPIRIGNTNYPDCVRSHPVQQEGDGGGLLLREQGDPVGRLVGKPVWTGCPQHGPDRWSAATGHRGIQGDGIHQLFRHAKAGMTDVMQRLVRWNKCFAAKKAYLPVKTFTLYRQTG